LILQRGKKEKMNWLIIVALVILGFAFIKMRHIKHKFYLIILLVVILFVYVSATRVLSNKNFDFRSASDIGSAVKLYFSWLGSVGGNFKNIVGHVISMDWNLNKTAT